MQNHQQRRLLLEAQRRIVMDQLDRLQLDQRRGDTALEADFAEQAVQCENDEVVDRLEQRTRDELRQLDRALARIAAGHADQCERCGQEIGRGRLVALPAATLCAGCAAVGEDRGARSHVA